MYFNFSRALKIFFTCHLGYSFHEFTVLGYTLWCKYLFVLNILYPVYPIVFFVESKITDCPVHKNIKFQYTKYSSKKIDNRENKKKSYVNKIYSEVLVWLRLLLDKP